MNRYYGQLMYCAFLPFSIYAPNREAALTELQKLAPDSLTEAERKEVLFHLTRIPAADRVTEIRKEPTHVTQANDAQSAQKTSRVLRKVRRGRFVSKPSADSQGA